MLNPSKLPSQSLKFPSRSSKPFSNPAMIFWRGPQWAALIALAGAMLFLAACASGPVVKGEEKAEKAEQPSTAAVSAAAPAATTAPATAAAAPAGPIWSAESALWPLDPIRLTPGERRHVSLAQAVREGIAKIREIQPCAELPVIIQTEPPNALTFQAPPKSSGKGVIRINAETGAGDLVNIALLVIVENLPLVEFRYAPGSGKSPKSVSVAGSFNGWNMNHDMLVQEDDGAFWLRKPLAPGKHTYKFVVDGQWISDPANPEMEEGGYGNSVLNIKGEAKPAFSWEYLSPGMAGAGDQGALRAALESGDGLNPQSIQMILNNQELNSSAWELDAARSLVRLKVPGELWGKENYVLISGTSNKGRMGAAVIPAAYRDAARSPRDEVIYFAFTDRFFDGDPSINHPAKDKNLLPLADYCGGDWAGVTRKIEEGYFDRLGVTTIWISPPYKNTPKVEKESVDPGRYYTGYHGYWPTSLTETNEQFGSMNDLKALVAAAHRHRIAILLDFVANHVHEDHPLYRSHPQWSTPLQLPDGRNNIRLFDEHPFTTWFDTFLPTLNYDGNDEIIKVMADNAVYWLRESGADGFRHDAVKHIPEKFWNRLTARLREEFLEGDKPRRIYQVGETISGYDTVAHFTGPDFLDGQFDFPGYFAMRDVLARGEGSMEGLAESLNNASKFYYAGSVMSPLIGNHDVSRFLGIADGDMLPDQDEKEVGYKNPPRVDQPESYAKLRMAFAWLMTIPGAPMIYYGDEIGMTGAGDPDNRRPMPWTDWSGEQKQILEAASALGRARHESVALRRGGVQVLFADKERLVFARVAPEETVLIALARKPAENSWDIPLPASWGAPASLQPLLEQSDLTAVLQSNRLQFKGAGNWAYGAWRVQFK